MFKAMLSVGGRLYCTCLWMRPRNLSHVSSSLMLPTDDSLARYLTERAQQGHFSLLQVA